MRSAAAVTSLLGLLGALGVGCTTPVRITECTSSAECAASETCIDRTCVPRPDAAAGCDGACECALDSDCRDTVPACADAACVGGTCFARPVDSRCAGGERCDPVLGCTGGGLDAGETLDGAAMDASASDAGSDAALDAPPDAPPGGVGAPCRADSDCAALAGTTGGPRCLLTVGGDTFVEGYCSANCSSTGGNCASGEGRCVLPSGGGFMPLCMRSCSAPPDCRSGYRCERVGVFSSADVCAPPGL